MGGLVRTELRTDPLYCPEFPPSTSTNVKHVALDVHAETLTFALAEGVSGQSIPAKDGRLKTIHFEVGVALGRWEPHSTSTSKWLVLTAR
jgi:hypothetical protein